MAWGFSVGMDINGCNPLIIQSKEKIQEYVIELCKRFEMTRYGDVKIDNFGKGNKEGFTMVQLIEMSCITAHFSNELQCAFIDLFSCIQYDEVAIVKFSIDFFEGKSVTVHSAERG